MRVGLLRRSAPPIILKNNHASRFIQHFATSPGRSPLAFAFDIDGVLIHGKHALPAARRAFNILDGQNPFGVNIPRILLTNGGGKTEKDRAAELSEMIGCKIHEKELVQSHTVIKRVVQKHAHSPVLILGGSHDGTKKVAQHYGFTQAYNSSDVWAWNPKSDPSRLCHSCHELIATSGSGHSMRCRRKT